MLSHQYSSEAAFAALMQQVRRLISQRKGIRLNHLHPTTDLPREFGFEAIDMVDIILAVESRFQLTIPDEVPLRTPGDFVGFLHEQVVPKA
ncbi:acyl carrier protein [Hymenobacter psoromatis]|uniref:acyl carrier protein n=1 Tax=Hymenobacter psoromatis TaxID=1484116 RepID=UPI001CBCF728|nr:phosphopantetheine-binding protein [Hymenobacter psoromatis]